jgi:hypothetical protein
MTNSGNSNSVGFRVSINRLYPGEKIVQGDRRQSQYHGAFHPETHSPETLLAAIQKGQAFCAELLAGDCGREHHGQHWCCKERRDKADPNHCGRPEGYRHSHHFRSSQVLALDDDGRNLSIDELLADPFIAQYTSFILVIDPLLAFTGKADTHKTAEVRGLLSPISAMAERTGCAVLGVMHPNKNSHEANLLYRISASLDFAAAARSVMVVAKHPDNPDQRVMATVKCNLSAHPEPMAFGFTHDGHFTWQGVTEVDVSQLLAPPLREEDRSELEEAISFLQALLADGPIGAAQAEAERKEMGI